jgi:DNA-binding NarL/FixJ family response regulator
MEGITIIDELHQQAPMSNIIVVSSFYDEKTALSVISREVMGYLCKPVEAEHLVQALNNATLGIRHYSPEVERHIRNAIAKGHHVSDNYNLTRQEMKTLSLVVEDCLEKEMAERLMISVHTVHNHLTNIYRKLNVHSRQEAAAKIVRESLLPEKK